MTKPAFFAAARSFSHANLMYQKFKESSSDVHILDFNHYFITPQGIYFLLWFSLLFNVCAFLKNQKAIPKSIEKDLQKVYEDLKQCRHVTFHIPPSFYDDRFRIFLKPSSWKTVEKIHHALSKFFDDEFLRYGEETYLHPNQS
ncbi:MAG: hypothetical protein L6246_01085 [Thermodesulfovibrionales bacterium]|nr:hypothetical protein [Nitrospinota bacterium]MCG2708907.1 hypothetical protein [Thermodesulfovibrionales bacterium]